MELPGVRGDGSGVGAAAGAPEARMHGAGPCRQHRGAAPGVAAILARLYDLERVDGVLCRGWHGHEAVEDQQLHGLAGVHVRVVASALRSAERIRSSAMSSGRA